MPSDESDLELLKRAALEAGRLAERFFRRNPNTWTKEGGSPVSEADIAVDRHLRTMLVGARPDYGWLSEEFGRRSVAPAACGDFRRRPDRRHARFYRRERPLVREPRRRRRGTTGGRGAERAGAGRDLCRLARRRRVDGRVPLVGLGLAATSPVRGIAGPRGWLQTETIRGSGAHPQAHIPSLAYRFAQVAANRLDAAFAGPRAHDWDLAASHLLVHEAGGRLTELDGLPPRYNREVPAARRACGDQFKPPRAHVGDSGERKPGGGAWAKGVTASGGRNE